MKRLLLLPALLLMAAMAMAQAPQTTDTVPAGTAQPAAQTDQGDAKRSSVIDQDGWTGDYYLYNSYHANRKNHGFDEFSVAFLELGVMGGWHQGAIGLNLAYVPNRWGGYAEGYIGSSFNTLNVGGVLRLMDDSHLLDWQLYGGLCAAHAPGLQLGMRLSSKQNAMQRSFSWWSLSGSSIWVGGERYFTAGLSIGLAATSLLLIWW